jgi:hypothetical protein
MTWRKEVQVSLLNSYPHIYPRRIMFFHYLHFLLSAPAPDVTRSRVQTPLAVRAGEGTLPCLSGGRARRSSGMLGGLRREAGERLSGPRTLIFAQQACSIATDSISPDRFELPRHQINQHGHRIELHNHQIAFHSHRIDIRRCRFEACCHRIELGMRSWRAWPLHHVLFFLQQG